MPAFRPPSWKPQREMARCPQASHETLRPPMQENTVNKLFALFSAISPLL